MIYCIYKIEHAGFSCWPGKPDAQGVKVAEISWVLWLIVFVAVVEPVLSPWATLQCHHLIACCTADVKKMQKVLEPSWNGCGGWTAEGSWVKTGTFTEHCLVADAQLPTGFSLFVGPRTWKCVGCDGRGSSGRCLIFGMCSIGTRHFCSHYTESMSMSLANYCLLLD